MTPEQWELFKGRLGESCAYYWCERAEDYAEQHPRRWAKYKDHFRTLNNWHSMRVADGYLWFEHPDPTCGPGYYKSWIVDSYRNAGGK
jgi:hypothetical protein